MADGTINSLRPTKAPNIQITPPAYDRQNEDLFRNQLRIYFTQVDNANQQVIQAVYSQSVLSWLDGGM